MKTNFKMRWACSMLVLACLWASIHTARAEDSDKVSLSGNIKDSKSGEDLIGASVYIKETKQSASTNAYGFFSITLHRGTYTLQITYMGYKTLEKTIELTANTKLNFELEEESVQINEVVVSERRPDENVRSTQMSMNRLKADQMKKLPAFFGEVDVVRNIQMLPGIQTAGEGTSAFYVRGGGANQNLLFSSLGHPKSKAE